MENNNFRQFTQKILCENTDTPEKSASVQRRSLFLTYNESLKTFDNASSCAILEKGLKNYSKTIDNDRSNIYMQKLNENLLKYNIKKQSPNLKSSLNKIDLTKLIETLPCSPQEINCTKSENASLNEYKEFIENFKRTSKKKPPTNLASSSTKNYSKLFEAPIKNHPTTSSSSFKTANEELQAQNLKKYGTAYVHQQSNAFSGGQKRKLGTRRPKNSKFVPPLITSNNSEEQPKSEEWSTEVDERLKNIEPKMVELIKAEIMDCGATVTWDDIAGLQFAKTAIQEAVVWPMLRPDIFTGLRRPPKGILLFGPPGTGKTLIGKCVASQSKSTFFSISASSLTSKWIGDGEKMVRALFAVARVHQPAVIFIDEIDSLLSQRSETEHESSRRIKTEFLVQLDGAATDNEERLLVVGATNRPQELDEAARRRFVKRLYIPLPELEARLHLVKKLICNEKHELFDENFLEIARLSDGYSGADIRNLCAEASMGPIRSLDINLIEQIQATQVRPLIMDDFHKAFARVRSSVSPKDLDQYVVWDNTYGSGGVGL